jgi:hypothetical protein
MIKIEVTGETAEEVFAQLKGLVAPVAGMSSADLKAVEDARVNKADDEAREAMQAERDAKKPARKPKAEKPVEGNVSTSNETDVSSSEASEPSVGAEEKTPEAGETLNYETGVAPKVLEAVARVGKPAVEALYEEYGITRASQLDPARWPELLARLGDLG